MTENLGSALSLAETSMTSLVRLMMTHRIVGKALNLETGVGASGTPVPIEILKIWVPLGTKYRENLRNWVPLGTGKIFTYADPCLENLS